jgi:hypothetical protein
MKRWWVTYVLRPSVLPRLCAVGKTVYDADGYIEVFYICDKPAGHKGLHLDKVEGETWTTGQALRRMGPRSVGETR